MSDATRVLIVGGGSIGERHLRCFAATGGTLLSLCEIRPAVRDDVARRYSLEQVFADYQQALASGPELVVLCTPAHLHVPMALAAARAGANLLIEKPLSTSLEGVDELREAVRQRGLVAAVAYVYRCHPALAAMREAIAGGQFGKPLEVVAACGQNFPHYRPAYREIYYKDRATGGGAVQDALTHIANAGQWLAGEFTELVADLAHLRLPGVEVEDTAHVLSRQGGVLGSYSLNQHQAPNETTITVVCEHGTARFEYHRARWRWQREPETPWQDEPAGALERDTLFQRQAEAMLEAVRNRRTPPCTLDEAVHTLHVNLAILRSAESRRWEAVGGPTRFDT